MNERQLFEAALEFAEPERRADFLTQACGADAPLRAAVDSLLKAHSEASSEFLARPAHDGVLSTEQTQTLVRPSEDADDEDIVENEAEAAVLKFLSPSTKPGSLGRLAHYEILEFLGRGAFGVVLKAFDEKLHRMVAVKMMNPSLAATSPPRKRFLREARSSAAVRHENIVAIYAVEEQPVPYLVMEYIPGQTLQGWLDKNGPLELKEILKFGQQIASGLAAAHAQTLIHRDIKPANILIDDAVDARAKITDFGLARAVDDASMTQSGLIAGTPMYMAPEQARGQTLDHRADLFSLGTVLYTMASGRPPFRAANTVAVLRRVCDDTPRPISEVQPGSPPWLDTIVAKLLAKEPEDRYQTAKEVSELLARCQSELQLTGKVTSVPASGRREPVESPAPSPTPAISEVSRPPLAMKPLLLAMLLGVLMMFPILFGRHLSRAFNAWYWPPIPALPVAELGTGLHFDGKDDSVEFAPVDWSFPQYTIEAFVTSTLQSDNGNIVSLTSGGKPWEMMELYDGHPASPGSRSSGAQIMGKTAYATAYGPLTPGVRQHRVLVFDGSHMHYYINGLWQGKRAAEAQEGKQWKLKKLRIGCDGDGKKFFEGIIDQLRISRVARYNDNFAPVTSVESDDQTLALYNFDARQGDVLRDASGNGHDGKIVGAKWAHSASGGSEPVESPVPPPTPADTEGLHPPLAESGQVQPADPPTPRQTPDPVVLQTARTNLAEKELYRDQAKQSHLDGQVTALDVIYREIDVCEANIHLTQTEGDPVAILAAFMNLVPFREQEHAMIAQQVKAGQLPEADVLRADASLRDAQGRLSIAVASKPAIAPFDAAQAKIYQAAWAKHLGVPVEYTNSIGMKFVLIPPGEFLMGSTPEEIAADFKNASPNDMVILTQPIYLGVNEVTQSEYEKVMGVNPSHFAPIGMGQEAVTGLETANHPVEMVSWNDAAEFSARLSQQEELNPFYLRAGETITPLDGTGYRLPSEAEWEFACRAGTPTMFWIGDQDEDLVRAGWFRGNSEGRTHAASELQANPFGLADMHGNVWEWVQDGWDATFEGQFHGKPAINPNVPFYACSQRVLRGGHWQDSASNCRSSNRLANVATNLNLNLGFRVSLMADAVKELLKRTVDSVAAMPPDPDRELAEWALSTSNPNVAFVGREAGSPKVGVTKLADLPAGAFYVTDVVVNVDGATFSDADLERMARVSQLKQITINTVVFDQACPLITDRGIETLSRAAFAGRLEMLTLYSPCPNITAAAIPSVNRFTGLQSLSWKCASITAAGIEQLELPELRGYGSWAMPYTVGALSRMAERSPQIYTLTVGGAPLGGGDLTPLARWRLTHLDLDQCGVSDADLTFIGTLSALKSLHLGNSPGISRAGISHLMPLTELEDLDINQTKIDDEGVPLVSGFTKLKSLNLYGTLITDLGLETLAGMPTLTTLHITGCQGITEAGVRKLQTALPKCQITSDFPAVAAMPHAPDQSPSTP